METTHSRLRICIFWLLAIIEFFERYGFYVLNALLMILLTKHLGWSDKKSYSYAATITSLFYLGPLVGGWLTDHLLNNKDSLTIGACFLCAGYILLSFWPEIGINIGVSSLIIGMSFFKFSPSAMIGNLYSQQRHQLDRLFVIFYVSINVGALVAYFTAAWLAFALNWHFVFLLPATGLFITILLSFSLYSFLNKVKNDISPHTKNIVWIVIGAIISLILLSIILNYTTFIIYLSPIVALIFILLIAKQGRNLQSHEKKNLVYIFIMCIVATIFFILYADQSTLITLFTEHMCRPQLFGLTIKPSTYPGFDSVWILLLAPVFNIVFKKIDKKTSKYSLMLKFGSGLIISGLGFLLIYLSIFNSTSLHSVNPLWVIICFAFQATGEVLISALGLSLMAKYAPKSLYNACMGGWFIVIAVGSSLAGLMNANLASTYQGESIFMIIQHYQHSFLLLAIMAGALGLLLLVSTKTICRKIS